MSQGLHRLHPLSLVLALVRRTSWPRWASFGALLGELVFFRLGVRRPVVLANLGRALPDHPDHVALARSAARQLGRSTAETLKAATVSPSELALRVRVEGWEHYERARGAGRGVILVTAHFGAFDLLAMSHAVRGAPPAIVSRALDRPGWQRVWLESRERLGITVFAHDAGPRPLVEWLRAGRSLGLVVDQRTPAERRGILAPFCGVAAWTTTLPARLAARTGSALVPVCIERETDGRHVARYEPALAGPASRDEAEIARVTREINETLERWVRRRPDHFLWQHRRFAAVEESRSGSAVGE